MFKAQVDKLDSASANKFGYQKKLVDPKVLDPLLTDVHFNNITRQERAKQILKTK